MCPSPGDRQKSPTKIGSKKNWETRSCNLRGQSIEDISIQKLNEAREKVTIMKQRTQKPWLNKTVIEHRFTSSKVRLSGLRPEPFQLHWPHWLPGLRERVSAWKTTRQFFPGSTRTIFYTGSSRTWTWKVRLLPEFQRLRVGRCILCQSNKRT